MEFHTTVLQKGSSRAIRAKTVEYLEEYFSKTDCQQKIAFKNIFQVKKTLDFITNIFLKEEDIVKFSLTTTKRLPESIKFSIFFVLRSQDVSSLIFLRTASGVKNKNLKGYKI